MSYLPPNLPHNRGEWPRKYVMLEQLDFKANRLIIYLRAGDTSRQAIADEIAKTDEEYRQFFRDRLNYWLEFYKKKNGE